IRSRAAALKPWACTVSALLSSPFARIFTGTSRRVASPFSRSASGVTSAPASKRCSRLAMFTGWVCVRNGSKGIDFFISGPRSLRMRMWIGFWPPSKRTRRLLPEREPAPFWPGPGGRAGGVGRSISVAGVEAEHLSDRQAAQLGDLFGRTQRLQPGHRRLHEIDRVLRAEALRQDVVDPGQLEYRAHAATRDYA